MRDWKLISTINGGHKRSVRCVGWKDYGEDTRRKKRKVENEQEERKPVMLATGSFDANCGLWEFNQKGQDTAQDNSRVPGAFEDDVAEQDFTNEGAEEDEEDWHFSTLLTGPDSEIKDLGFSPPHYGANLLATCSRDKSVWVWEEVEPEEWETVAVLSEHTGDVKCVEWLRGAKTTKVELRRRLRDRGNVVRQGGGEDMEVETSTNGADEEESVEVMLGGRELLASGSYDDTIRLHHDDEAEGDWITIAVLTGHDGTVWDLKFEPFVSLASYPPETTEEEIFVDWAPRLISCSDDMTVRVWKKQLSEKEVDEKRMRIAEARKQEYKPAGADGEQGVVAQTGFSGRIPSRIRVSPSTEKWVEETSLPTVHVRSVYAVDWSALTGLVVTTGGDGVIAVYKEVAAPVSDDVVMNGTAEHSKDTEGDIKKVKTEWKVVAVMEAAHDEYEINHVCWVPRRDRRRQNQLGVDEDGKIDQDEDEDEEFIVSTGDDGQVRVWQLPTDILQDCRQER